ncbi:MAG: NADH-quinone oxidoreductase subunit NuoF [Marinilabiliales bacterium]|nr:MAG: NADH-quinone oxidoreductase subunit NuoF [Marinilabiliales bacterium]
MTKPKVIVGLGSCGIAAGAGKVYEVIRSLKEAENMDFSLSRTSCSGMCYREPLVEIIDETGWYLYGGIDEDRAVELLNNHVANGNPVSDYIVCTDLYDTPDSRFFKNQVKIALRNCGRIDPERIGDYEARGGYEALRKIITGKLSPLSIIKEVTASGLRGRGGGGFPTGLKWKFTHDNKSSEKFVICNADEGDPGAFMDRSLLEGDPHSVIEGMIIAALAVEASAGIIYCRAEYPLALRRLDIAINQSRDRGYLGKGILGHGGINFDISVKEGAGAFVCGEETALIASVEGFRGMPGKRPPFPAESGLWKKPTNINNVETFASIPWIISEGASRYAAYGTEKSKGTKVFALAGKIRHGGLVEVPMGITIKDIVFGLGGGIPGDKNFKAVQLGGPSGGCIPAWLADTPVDYESVNATGAIMGSGGMVVMDETTCMVDIARFFLDFTARESCGKCTFCRIGTMRMLEILERITKGSGEKDDIGKLEELAEQIKEGSLCGLGQTAPNPVLTTIRYFRDEYEAHINMKKCPAKVCKQLLRYEVNVTNCTGCTVCARNCPVDAISGERKQVHFIDQDICTRCGICYSKCRFEAITVN